MKNIIFLVSMACLLAGCAGKGQTLMKIKTESNVTSEQGLPVKIMPQDEKPLPIKIVPDKVAVGAFVASLIAVCATTFAAIAAWRAAYNTKKALEKIKNKIHE
ncbi:MAG: hypothetical protein WAK60_08150 [Sedimentisphaerales bacterium]